APGLQPVPASQLARGPDTARVRHSPSGNTDGRNERRSLATECLRTGPTSLPHGVYHGVCPRPGSLRPKFTKEPPAELAIVVVVVELVVVVVWIASMNAGTQTSQRAFAWAFRPCVTRWRVGRQCERSSTSTVLPLALC